MSLAAALAAMTTKTISSITGMSSNNCKTIDESVFNYIQTTAGAPSFCAIVEYAGFSTSGGSEFRSTSPSWGVSANYYHMIRSENDYVEPYQKCIAFIDKMILEISKDPTLGGTVMGVKVASGSNPIPYKRGSFWYITVDVVVRVIDNIS